MVSLSLLLSLLSFLAFLGFGDNGRGMMMDAVLATFAIVALIISLVSSTVLAARHAHGKVDKIIVCCLAFGALAFVITSIGHFCLMAIN